MANVDNITDVTIGSAAAFRNTVNSNFDILKTEWTGIYVGPELTGDDPEATAKEHLSLGGLWIVTSD